jgi:hypothetical protein
MTEPVLADVPSLYEITGDPRVVEHKPSERLGSLAEAEALVGRWMGHWGRFGFGYWSSPGAMCTNGQFLTSELAFRAHRRT